MGLNRPSINEIRSELLGPNNYLSEQLMPKSMSSPGEASPDYPMGSSPFLLAPPQAGSAHKTHSVDGAFHLYLLPVLPKEKWRATPVSVTSPLYHQHCARQKTHIFAE